MPRSTAKPTSETPDNTARTTWPAWLQAIAKIFGLRQRLPAAPHPAPPTKPGAGPEAQGSHPAAAQPADSLATTALAYRQDAARHLYQLNRQRIYQGMLPPLLHAIGVLDVHLDAQGQVLELDWRRIPSHAPEVVREIERTARAAAPYPPPRQMGTVIYTDTWLWDVSGHFQLDTLTEGQRGYAANEADDADEEDHRHRPV